jgi:hypothetical protein
LVNRPNIHWFLISIHLATLENKCFLIFFRIDDQILSDEIIARHLQEEENKTSSHDSKAVDNSESLLRQRRELEEQDRSKARREQVCSFDRSQRALA